MNGKVFLVNKMHSILIIIWIWIANESEKLKIITTSTFDDLADSKKWDFKGYNSFFCCLGSRVQQGKVIKFDIIYNNFFLYNRKHLSK